MKTTLLSLDFKNWRGFTGLIEFNPDRNVFSGPNGSGKTRIPDAVSWVLTGKDTRGKSDSELKSIVDGSPVQKSEHGVLAVYDIDGKRREFGRTFSEKWSKKRGSLEATKDGNQTVFSVDGIEVSKTKYAVAVASAFGENYPLCSDLSAVTGMEWKKRREMLISMVGEVIDQEKVFESLDGLIDFLIVRDSGGNETGRRSIEDAKTAADQRKKDLKKKIPETNAAIEERQADVDKVGGVDLQTASGEVIKAEHAAQKAKEAIEKAKGGDQSGNIEKLKELNGKLFKAEADFDDLKLKAQLAVDRSERGAEIIQAGLKNDRENLQDHQEEREKLLTQYHSIKGRQPGDLLVCGECGQNYPAEKHEERINNFNVDKSEDLEKNMARGKDVKKEIALIESQIQAKEKELSELQAVEPDPILKDESTPEIQDLQDKIAKLNTASNNVGESKIPAELTATLEACETRLKQAQETRAAVNASSDSVKRLEELKTKKQELSAENDRIEKFLSLHQQYEQALADAIEKPVNDMFEVAYFKMFSEQEKADEDGNFKQVPACIVMDKQKRPFDTALSNGERIQLQLDVAMVMQKHFDISPPVFVDNAESVTDPIYLDCQFVELRAMLLYVHNDDGFTIYETEYNALSDAEKASYSLIETLTKEV